MCYEIVGYNDLRGADVRGLLLYSVALSHVQKERQNFSGTHLWDSVFLDCPNFSQAVKLEAVG